MSELLVLQQCFDMKRGNVPEEIILGPVLYTGDTSEKFSPLTRAHLLKGTTKGANKVPFPRDKKKKKKRGHEVKLLFGWDKT
jgi:hypothetical protein